MRLFAYILIAGVFLHMKIRNNLTKINEYLEIPKEVISDIPKITMVGNEELIIENCKGILEYEEFFIKLNTSIGNLNINGFKLVLSKITEDNISIKGIIENIDFECR